MLKTLDKLKKNSNLSLEANEKGGLDLGIELSLGPIEFSVSTEDGGTVGVGLKGVVGIEMNAEGGGAIEMAGGMLKMEVTVEGCTRITRDYIGGALIRTEVEKIEGCDEKKEKKKEKIEEGGTTIEIIADFAPTYSGQRFFYMGAVFDGTMYDIDWEGDSANLTQGRPVSGGSYPRKYPLEVTNDLFISTSGMVGVDAGGNGIRATAYGSCSVGATAYGFGARDVIKDLAGAFWSIGFTRVAWKYYPPIIPIPGRRNWPTRIFVASSTRFMIEDQDGRPFDSDYLPPIPGGEYIQKEEMNKECCFTENDRKLLKLLAEVLAAEKFPGCISQGDDDEHQWYFPAIACSGEKSFPMPNYLFLNKFLLENIGADEKVRKYLGIGQSPKQIDEEVYSPFDTEKIGFPLIIPDYLSSELDKNGKPLETVLISNFRELILYESKLSRKRKGLSLEKIEKFLGIGDEFLQIGEEVYTGDSDNIGFPFNVPDQTENPTNEDGTYIKDPKKYPLRTIRNFSEFIRYQAELFRRLYLFSGAGPTVENGYEIQVSAWNELADKDAVERPQTMTGIISRLISIIIANGLPQFVTIPVKTPAGKVPFTPLGKKELISLLAEVLVGLDHRVTRAQITLGKLALTSSALLKLANMSFRMISLVRQGIGFKWRIIHNHKASMKETGTETILDDEFNSTNYQELFAKAGGDKEKAEEIESLRTLLLSDANKLLDYLNKNSKIKVPNYALDSKTLSLWEKLFGIIKK